MILSTFENFKKEPVESTTISIKNPLLDAAINQIELIGGLDVNYTEDKNGFELSFKHPKLTSKVRMFYFKHNNAIQITNGEFLIKALKPFKSNADVKELILKIVDFGL